MTKAALIKKLAACAKNGDWETAHAEADDALVEFINDPEIAEAYAAVGKWYA